MPLLANLKSTLRLPEPLPQEPRAPVVSAPTSVLFPGVVAPTSATAPGMSAIGAAPVPPKILTGGRATWDSPFLFGAGMPVILPPDGTVDEWRRLDLDAESI